MLKQAFHAGNFSRCGRLEELLQAGLPVDVGDRLKPTV
jgi:hypothetical protein